MAVWTENHLACTTLWSTLRALQQYKAVFDDAGDLTMEDLTFWKKASDDLRETAARSLAAQIDGVFVHVRLARYEDDVTTKIAVNKLTETLVTSSSTVAELAEVADALYRFLDE